MSKKILVLGSTGLIGHQVFNYLNNFREYELFNLSRNKLNSNTFLLNVREEKNFSTFIEKLRPNIIINCIGALIDESHNNPENAIYLNAFFPHALLSLSDKINAKLIHMSTDCVFSGLKTTPYIETNLKDGIDVYAKSKGLGEIINDRHLTIRTSVVGPEIKFNGTELFHWFMTQSNSINGFKQSIWSGVTTIELAKAVKWAIDKDINGLYHLTNNQSINKNDLLKLFKKYTKKDIEINEIDGRIVDKSFIDTRAEINYKIPSYEKMIKDMVVFIKKNKSLYNLYNL